MAKQSKQAGKIDGRTAPAKRRRALVAAYEAQIGSALSPAARSLIEGLTLQPMLLALADEVIE